MQQKPHIQSIHTVILSSLDKCGSLLHVVAKYSKPAEKKQKLFALTLVMLRLLPDILRIDYFKIKAMAFKAPLRQPHATSQTFWLHMSCTDCDH